MDRKNFLVAVHLFLRKWNEILLYKRRWWSQDGLYNLIAWHLDGWETPVEAIIREAQEEAWIIIKSKDLQFSHVAHSFVNDEQR